MSEMAPLPASTVVGPPLAWTPVYRLLSSWNLLASALVPEKLGPPTAQIASLKASKVVFFFEAHSFIPLAN
jgi:hypothetical protein